jgi:capsular polysaccharide transport system ATP-binding protein
MIQLIDVSKAYKVGRGRKNILTTATLTFERRNIAVIGQNGAGKSTLLRLIAGAERPDRGRIVTAGRVSWPLGFSGGFNGSTTGVDNTRFISRIYGQDHGSRTGVRARVLRARRLLRHARVDLFLGHARATRLRH